MKRIILITIAILASSLLFFSAQTGCEGGVNENAPVPAPAPTPAPMPSPAPIIEIPPYAGDTGTSSNSGSAALPEERMIVQNADMSIVVADVLKARDEITSLAQGLGGFVVSANIYGDEGSSLNGQVSIRVPADSFESTLTQIRSLAVRVTSESTNSEDITEEYVDLQSRLRNAQAAESQYLALLTKSNTVQDTLDIYQALTSIRYDIEQIKGRIEYLDRTVAMSQISVSLSPSVRPVVSPEWSLPETLNSAVRGLATFGHGLGTAFVWIGIFSPIWGTALGIGLWRRHRRKKLAQAQAAK